MSGGDNVNAPAFRDRIVEFRRIKASDLTANAKNWRLHPESQKGALTGVLKEIGFTGALVARIIPGGFELLDGHLRADISGDEIVPVLIVDLNDEEASKMLATFDPISTMALVDTEALSSLLGEVTFAEDNAELRRMMETLHDQLADEETATPEAALIEVPGMALEPHEHYDYMVVLCTTAQEWNILCDRLGLVAEKRRKRMGTCRAVRASKLLPLIAPR